MTTRRGEDGEIALGRKMKPSRRFLLQSTRRYRHSLD